MNLRSLFFAGIAAIASVQGEVSFMNHDQIQPFPQLQPTTDSEQAAVMFKPQVRIVDGCYPYPAVNTNGSLNGGLAWSGPEDGDCKGSSLGSQVYSRSASYQDKWAIMYAWYFPKSRNYISNINSGQRHYWKFAIVWIDDPSLENPTILGVSTPGTNDYFKQTPPKSKYIDGLSIRFQSDVSFWGSRGRLKLTTKGGDTQDLITWEQLTDKARDALSEFELNVDEQEAAYAQVPFKDGVFT